jgi:putative salt-induced outer membrane protein
VNPLRSGRLGCAALIAAAGLAANPAAADWSGTGELGLVFARGNTDTETLNGELNLAYAQGRWTNETSLSFLRSETDGDLDANRFVAANNTNYALSERSYIVGSARYDRDEFSAFDYQASAAIGYGRKLIDSERQTFSLEAGPGVRYSKRRPSGDTETDLIGRAAADYRWAISDTSEFTNATLVETGSANTFLENQTALTVAINDALALKTAFSVRHNTDVEGDREKTDYLTTVNIVYSFE